MACQTIPTATMNEAQAAEYLGVSVFFLRKYRSEGNVDGRTPGPPFLKLGRCVRYLPEDLDTWLRDNRQPAVMPDQRAAL